MKKIAQGGLMLRSEEKTQEVMNQKKIPKQSSLKVFKYTFQYLL